MLSSAAFAAELVIGEERWSSACMRDIEACILLVYMACTSGSGSCAEFTCTMAQSRPYVFRTSSSNAIDRDMSVPAEAVSWITR